MGFIGNRIDEVLSIQLLFAESVGENRLSQTRTPNNAGAGRSARQAGPLPIITALNSAALPPD